jgi:hypothetical protein
MSSNFQFSTTIMNHFVMLLHGTSVRVQPAGVEICHPP